MRPTAIFSALALLAVTTAAHGGQLFPTIGRRGAADLQATAQTACARPDSPACQEANEALAHRVANDLMILATARDRQHRELARQAADVPFAEVRAAAAAALGAMGPDRDDTETLKTLLNDPVPAVRHPALRALGRSSDPAKRALLERVKTAEQKANPDELSLEADPGPDAQRLGVPIYSGATFLHFASNLPAGRAAFVTDHTADAVLRFYARSSPKPAMTAEELERTLAMAPPMSQQDMQKTMAQSEAMMKRLEELQKSGKSPQEIMAEIQKLTAPMPKPGPAPAAMIRPYQRSDLYGSPRFVLLSKPEEGTAALRYAVVFQDLAVGKTGIVLQVPAAQP